MECYNTEEIHDRTPWERKGQDGGGEMVESDAPVRSTEERDDAERGKETMLSSVEGI